MSDEEKIETPGWITTQAPPDSAPTSKLEVPRPRKSRRTQAQMAEAEARGEKPRRGTSVRPPIVPPDPVDVVVDIAPPWLTHSVAPEAVHAIRLVALRANVAIGIAGMAIIIAIIAIVK